MKCLCNKESYGVVKNDGQEMTKQGEQYYLSGILYQKYYCPKCQKTKAKVLNGFKSGKGK